MFRKLILPTVSLALLAGAARAQDADLGSICADRPTRANATCTVPAGHWQVETDIANLTRNTSGGVRTTTLYAPNPYVKYGLADGMDLEVNWSPYLRARTTDLATGDRDTLSGVSDLYVRVKRRLVANDRATVSIIPFVKAPTAKRGLGNDKWEGGLALPVNLPLSNGFSLTLGPEVDLLADADGEGRHAAVINVVNLSRPLNDKLSVAAELWSSFNYDPDGTVRQYTADVAAAYLVTPTLQIDAGANFGLNRATPDTQIYVGVAKRF